MKKLVLASKIITLVISVQVHGFHIDRGIVAVGVNNNNETFITWRLLETDPPDIGFNIYRSTDGGTPVKLNSSVLSVLTGGTNYTDKTADPTRVNTYFVKPVIDGIEQDTDVMPYPEPESSVSPFNSYTVSYTANSPYYTVPIRSGGEIHFAWIGDFDGNGTIDFVIDRVAANPQTIEVYRDDGTFMWEVNFGPNSADKDNLYPSSGTIDVGHWDGVTAGDVNGDGKAEVIIKFTNGARFGDGGTFSDSNNDKQWIGVLEGTTGRLLASCQIPPDFIAVGAITNSLGVWLGIGNAGIYLHGKNRNQDGSFNQLDCVFTWDGSSSLSVKWKKTGGGAIAHQMRICDVNADGTDDLCHIGYVRNGNDGSITGTT